MSDYPTKLDFCDGKYTVIYDFKTGQSECLRYGEPWRQLVGDKMVLAMFDRVVELQTENAALKAELANEKRQHAIWESEHLKEYGKLQAELAAAQKDAERLAFVESRAYVGVNPHNRTCLWVLRGIYELPGQDFRAAIDEAIREAAKS